MILAFLAALNLAAQTDPAALSAEAKRAMESRQFPRAAQLYEQLTAAIPASAGLRMNLGLARFSQGNYRAAKPAFEAAVKLDPALGPAWLMLGLTERKLGEPARALPALEKAVAAQPANSVARMELADSYLVLQRNREAAREFRKFTQIAPAEAVGWFGLGTSAEGAAEDGLPELDRIAPGSPYRDALYARLRADAFQYRSAYHSYRKALQRKPAFPGIHTAIAKIYEAESKADWAAIERQREVPCKIEPMACEVIGGSYWTAAESTLKTPAAVYWRAIAWAELAREAFGKLEKLPPSAEMHRHRAVVLREQGRYTDAAVQFRQAMERKPDLPQLRRELARTLWLARDYEAAVPQLDRIIVDEFESAEVCYQLGDSLLNLDRIEEALKALGNAIQLDPGLPGLRGAAGSALVRIGKAAEAIPMLESALATDEDGRIHVQLSRAYQLAGQPEKSAAILEQRERRLAEIEKQKAVEEITAPSPDGRD